MKSRGVSWLLAVYNLLGETGLKRTKKESKNLSSGNSNVSPTYKNVRTSKKFGIHRTLGKATWTSAWKRMVWWLLANSLEQQQTPGFTAKSPRWAIAFKYKSGKHEHPTEWRNPSGRSLRNHYSRLPSWSRYSLRVQPLSALRLHNADEIERLDLRIGDFVFVEKGGEIIPESYMESINPNAPAKQS